MKTSFKKLVAGASIVALVAMNVAFTNVNWANANPSFGLIDLNGTPSVVTDDKVVVTIPTGIVAADGNAVTVVIKKDGVAFDATWKIAAVTGGAISTVFDANGKWVVTITTAATPATFEFTPWVAGNFTVSVLGTAWVGSAVISFGNANVVNVSATVMPFLDFSIDNTNFSLWELETLNYKTAALFLELATNANVWAKVSVASNWLVGTNTSKAIWFVSVSATNGGTVDNIDALDATNFYKYSVVDFNTDASTTKTDAATAITATTTPMAATLTDVITTSNVPGKIQKGFAVWAKRADLTEADNYTDTLTFTVTGSF